MDIIDTISPKEAAERAGMTRRAIMLHIEKGSFTATRNNKNHWRVDLPSFEEWLSKHEKKSKPSNSDTIRESIRAEFAEHIKDLEGKVKGLSDKVKDQNKMIKNLEKDKNDLRSDFESQREENSKQSEIILNLSKRKKFLGIF